MIYQAYLKISLNICYERKVKFSISTLFSNKEVTSLIRSKHGKVNGSWKKDGK